MSLACTQSLTARRHDDTGRHYRVLCGRPAVRMLNRTGHPRCEEHAGQPRPWSHDEVLQSDGKTSVRIWSRCWPNGTVAAWIAEDRGPDLIVDLREPGEPIFYYGLPLEEAKKRGDAIFEARERAMVDLPREGGAAEPSPSPWKADPLESGAPGWIRDANGEPVAEVYGGWTERVVANLARIERSSILVDPEGPWPETWPDELRRILRLCREITRDPNTPLNVRSSAEQIMIYTGDLARRLDP